MCEHLGGGVVELLDQLDLPDFGRHDRQAGEQALQIDGQQQGAVQGFAFTQAQRRGAVNQPALAHLVGFRCRCLAVFCAAQHVQGGKIHRCAAAHVLHGLAATIEVRIDYAVPVGEVAFGGAHLGNVLTLQGLQQLWIARGGLSVGAELLQGFLHHGRLAAAPGLAELLQLLLVGAVERAEPEQRTAQQAVEAGFGRFRFDCAAGQLGAGGDGVSVLGSALEEFHAASPRQFILKSD